MSSAAVTGLGLTEELIAEAMARAEKVACSPGDDRCSAFPCTPKGRCRVGAGTPAAERMREESGLCLTAVAESLARALRLCP